MKSVRMSENRGLVIGRMFTQDGRLVVSCAQEGLIRLQSVEAKL
jgi:acyl-CoA thioesterase